MLNFFYLNNYSFFFVKNSLNLVTLNSFYAPSAALKNVNTLFLYFFEKNIIEFSYKNIFNFLFKNRHFYLFCSLQIVFILLLV